MANQATVHNPYKDEIDFAQLALQDADFAKVYVAVLFIVSRGARQ